jgi:prepilin signal peptidase PulO-like enzyme (type II secretory pathway)
VWLELFVLGGCLWISYYDVKFHLIRNIDLLILLAATSFQSIGNLKYALFSLGVYISINIAARGSIGAGDIKLSFAIGFIFNSFTQVTNAILITWIAGGMYSLARRQQAIPFAPFMILGTYLVKIL